MEGESGRRARSFKGQGDFFHRVQEAIRIYMLSIPTLGVIGNDTLTAATREF